MYQASWVSSPDAVSGRAQRYPELLLSLKNWVELFRHISVSEISWAREPFKACDFYLW
ncbi:hypothetical protein VCRA2119O48_200095 [Vibrio crassostreae]|nr:hypothetical protein VCRA2119O48_200095 [Vibrio crassostreae]